MDTREFAERFLMELPFSPTAQQTALMAALSRFCTLMPAPDACSVFILNGYAGTGKTSVVGALVRTLRSVGAPTVLLAPTGRAAKVFSAAAGAQAWTIHRRIYRMPTPGSDGYVAVNVNRTAGTVFIVDEASMIGNSESEHSGSLLHDLLEHVFTGAPGCRLIFMGDTAQLPPVGCDTSPAMNPDTLRALGMKVSRAVITETVRQAAGSAILYNATRLRRELTKEEPQPPVFRTARDVKAISGIDLLDELSAAYAADGVDSTILITRSNRMATAANRAIRNGVFFSEEELVRGERLMIAKNNYLWSESIKELDFIANGDIATVTEIHSTEQFEGFRFADVTLYFPDRDVNVSCKVMLDTLSSDAASVEPQKLAMLYRSRLEAAGGSQRALKRDPHYNALQVKYAYAVTCHKAQGGQWKNVFVDASALYSPGGEDSGPRELFRWLYTAFTRATSTLTLVNAPDECLA